MSAEGHQYCPICQRELPLNARYPRYICAACAKRAVDEEGRSLEFYNEELSGGFAARYSYTGEARASHVCFIDGIRCWADEARFGGIIIQPMDD